jgi:hypothetical protein
VPTAPDQSTTTVPRSPSGVAKAPLSAMDEQIIPCFAAKPSATLGRPPIAPAVPAGKQQPSVPFGLAGVDPAVVPHVFMPVPVVQGVPGILPPGFHMPVQMPVPMAVRVAAAGEQQHQQHPFMPQMQPADMRLAQSGYDANDSPAAPPAQKPRWETPLRVGTWPEAWQSAVALASDAPVSPLQLAAVSRTVRATVAEAVVSIVGDHLPRPTVEKWLCLLSEYLELNADEQILVLCLLRRYVDCDGLFVGESDHLRPQKWEKVIAVACYLSVLLSEEFPGRTATDLRELLGPNFRFGIEQMAFLKQVDWRISISHEFYVETKKAVMTNDRVRLRGWFKRAQDLMSRRKLAERAAVEAKAKLAVIAAKAKHNAVQTPPLGKKRTAEIMSSPEDGVVPGSRRAREERYVALPMSGF